MTPWKMFCVAGVVLLPMLVTGVPVGAAPRPATVDDGQICEKEAGDIAIAGCTRAIASGKYKGHDLAIHHYNRGIKYRREGDNDRAFADYSKAIEIDPKYTSAYVNRGVAYRHKGDNDRAIADFSKAIEIDPKHANAYFNRALANVYAGSVPQALSDLNLASELNSKHAYTALWLDIVGKRSNLPSRLPQAVSQIDMTKWPAPVIRLFLGQLTPEATLAAADDADSTTKKGQVCEANFFSGELARQRGARERAIQLFQLAAADCPRTFAEFEAANAELKALGVQQ